jgi:signal transduction histidine kinase/AraC-like DNA-binding protein/ligand-binding sensor domain-containing protein
MNRNVRYLPIVSIFLLLQDFAFCQKTLEYEFMPPNIRWDNFLVKEGDASQESISLLIDSKGFVWTGTETGLYRFDGNRYVEYGVRKESREGFKGYGVFDIFEDSGNTIWIGTSEAVNMLDQKSGTFTSFSPDSGNYDGISNFIRAIREDRSGLLWILTRKDIFSFDKYQEKLTRFKVDSLSWYRQDSFFIHEDQCFTEDLYENKWFVTNKGLYLLDNKEGTFRMVLPDHGRPDLADFKKVNCVVADSAGSVWIGTEGCGLMKWNFRNNRPEQVNIQSDKNDNELLNSIITILPDNLGKIWCFGNSSFARYNTETGSATDYYFQYKHRTIYELPESKVLIHQAFLNDDGTIWFINLTAGLMFKFDPDSEKLFLYRTPYFMVYKCIPDKTGSFWFACIRNNITRMETQLVPYVSIQISNSANVSPEHKTNIIEDNLNRVWLLLNYGTFIYRRFDNDLSLKSELFRFPRGDTISGRGFSDSQGNLWFITNRGKIIRYNPGSGIHDYFEMPFPAAVGSGNFPMIREDRSGNIWIAAPRSGLFQIEIGSGKPVNKLSFDRKPARNEYSGLMDFFIDSRNNFWIVTGNALLMLKMPEMQIKDYTGSGDREFYFYTGNARITEDPGGNIWLLNNKAGLFLFDRKEDKFKRYSFSDEGPDSQYYDLLADRRGRLWISHNRGITIFDPVDRSTRLIQTQKLQSDVQSYQARSGHILYINNDRLYLFNEDIPVNKNAPPVYITRLLVNGTNYNQMNVNKSDVSSLDDIDLTFRNNSLSFEFAALNYFFPGKNKYRYFMQGFDKDTTLVGPGLAAEYKNLPPGRYRFWVTGSNNDGIWNSSGINMNIRIHPPWYRSAISYVFYGILFLSSIAVYIRLRINNLVREKKRLNEIVNSATAELERKNRQLAEMDRIKTHFFTDIAHEIRTPLTLINGPLENLSKEEMLSSRMSETIGLIKRNSKRLSHLVNQLLDISKLDSGKMKIILSEGDIIKDLKILLYEFLSLAESKKINYTVELTVIRFITWYDRDKTEKIVSNLLSNAFKFTPEKGRVHCIVKIDTGRENEYPDLLKIIVKDTGSGIETADHDKIFDRFYRVEEHREESLQGTGIGLSLVREFVTLLHGKISVHSTPGKGSDFIVEIPVGMSHLAEDEYIIARIENEPADTHPQGNAVQLQERYSVIQTGKGRIKILIVEDNNDLRNFIKDSLLQDYTILTAENGVKGVNTALEVIPDLIITDIMMPELDGINLCTQLKNDDRTSHIPVIMLTAKATTDNRIEGFKMGADDYISKPFDINELRIRITSLIAIRETLKKKFSKPGRFEIPGEKLVSADDRFMVKLLQILNTRIISHGFGVDSLCEIAGMSKRQLTRKLKAVTGLSPGILIHNMRLERAAELIISKTGNISEIANSVGLSNPSHFTNSFRRYFGVSPKNYPGSNSSAPVSKQP